MKHIYYICVGSYILLSFFAIRQWFRHIWQKKIKALEVHFFKSVEIKAEVKKGEEERCEDKRSPHKYKRRSIKNTFFRFINLCTS